VDIGGALAEARSEAGLTITQVSERTRIRETIIRDIERDDYSACGGDFYARGHIRAIARVVGTDPVPLIEEYDAASVPASEGVAPGPTTPVRVDPDADTDPGLLDGGGLEFDLPGRLWPGPPRPVRRWIAAVGSRLADSAPERTAPERTAPERTAAGTGAPRGARNGAAGDQYVPPGITAAEAFRPGLPLDFERRRPRRAGLLGLVALVVIGVLVYLLVAGGSHGGAPATPRSHHSARAAAQHAGSAAASTTARPAGARPAGSVPLTVASATAVGPGGASQGDDPQAAPLAIDGSAGTAWHTDWYATAALGGLQSGTGLLLSLDKTATIASATLLLGSTAGGVIELRAGDAPTLADLPVVAQAANPGGTLTMRPGVPVRARYLLIWFTSLPRDNAGTYEASLYDVRLYGTG
jgi:hypothetical protein